MRNLLLLLSILLLTSCSSLQFKYSTLNYTSNLDGIYSTSNPTITVIDNEFELDRRFRTDDRFRWDYAQYAMNQDLGWHTNFYWNNRMNRSPYLSSFDFYWNSNEFWWDWASNYQFNNGFNQRNRFGFNGNFGWNGYNNWGYGNSWYNPYNRWGNFYNPWNRYNWGNRYGWNNSYYNQPENRRNVSYSKGRRGSTNTPKIRQRNPRSTRVNNNQLNNVVRQLQNKDVDVRVIRNVNEGRRILPNPTTPNRIIQRPNTRTPQRTQTPRRVTPTRSTPPNRVNNRPTQSNTRQNVVRRTSTPPNGNRTSTRNNKQR